MKSRRSKFKKLKQLQAEQIRDFVRTKLKDSEGKARSNDNRSNKEGLEVRSDGETKK